MTRATRPSLKLDGEWHRVLNRLSEGATYKSWLYEAKALSHEIPRMAILFGMERVGKLPEVHRRCTHSPETPIPDNHLKCCLGVECRKCPELMAMETIEGATAEEIDQIKAHTCAAHILSSSPVIDRSEGYIQTVDDIMYWTELYSSMASAVDWYEDSEGEDSEGEEA